MHAVKQTKLTSFQRQLNLYGFSRRRGKSEQPHSMSYFHAKFMRGQKELVRGIVRCKIKGNGHQRRQDTNEKDKFDQRHPSAINNVESSTIVDVSTVQPFCIVPKSPQADDVEDGDLLFFEGSPFHFLDSKTVRDLSIEIKPDLLIPTSIEQSFQPLAPRRSFASRPKPASFLSSFALHSVEKTASV